MGIERSIVRGPVVLPSEMSSPERDALSRQLYDLHRKIFSGVSASDFRRHVVEPPAEATWIQLFLSGNGRTVGYCAVHRYWRRVQGRNCIVLRAEAGLIPEYRGRGVTYGFGIARALAERLKHPFTPVYYLGTLVHPSSYHLFCKYFPWVYPRPGFETQGHVREIARDLVESFPDRAVDPTDPFVRDVGWITIESPQEGSLTRRADLPDVRFFKARNPGYPKGHGLVVLVPMTLGNVLAALLARLAELALIVTRLRKPHL